MRKKIIRVPIITEWKSFTPTGSWSTNTTYTGKFRRVGDTIQVQVDIATSGAPTAASLTVNLPTGVSLDTNKIAAAVASGTTHFGTAAARDAGNAVYQSLVLYSSATAVQFQTYTTGSLWSETAPFTWGAGDNMYIQFQLPIVGWKSTRRI